MLENLSERLQGIFSGLRSKGRLTEDDINAAMREIRLALLEADVNFKVVKNFVARTKERCLSAEVLDSLTPAQNVVKIVLDELTELLGRTDSRLVLSSRIPNVIMLVGLQGSGKTTAAAKLAYRLKQENHSPLLIAGDVYRPAAADQLQTLGRRDRRAGLPRRRARPGSHRARGHPGRHRQPARRGHHRHGGPSARGRRHDGGGPGHQGRHATPTRSSWWWMP